MRKTSEVLTAARDDMLVQGWGQGKGYDEETGKVCVVGSIDRATEGKHDAFGTNWNEFKNACRAFQVAVGEEGIFIPYWNDLSTRTEDEVHDAFAKAIKACDETGD